MVKNVDVEGLHWDMTLRELITTFQYSSAIQLEITRPLDPKNLKANLRFLEERRYNDIIRALNDNSCIVQHENGQVTHVRKWSFFAAFSGPGSHKFRYCLKTIFLQKIEFYSGATETE